MGQSNSKQEKIQSNFLKTNNDYKINKYRAPNSSYSANDLMFKAKPHNAVSSTTVIKGPSETKEIKESSSKLPTGKMPNSDGRPNPKVKTSAIKVNVSEFNNDELAKTSALSGSKSGNDKSKVNLQLRDPNIKMSSFNIGSGFKFDFQNPEQENSESKYKATSNSDKNSQLEEKLFFQSVIKDLSQFNLIKVIGRGTFGKVVLVSLKTDPSLIFALKIIKKAHIVQTKNVANIINEKKILQEIDNPFIIKLRYSFQNKEKIFMAFDYHNGGELFFHLQKRHRLPEKEVKVYAAEMYIALKYLHRKGIIYRDIKPENIILDRNGHIKLIDFGLAKKLPRGARHTRSFCGTNEYIRKFNYYYSYCS